MGVTAKDNGGACFPLDFGIMPTIGRQPSHPHRSGFFFRFMPRMPPPIGILDLWVGEKGAACKRLHNFFIKMYIQKFSYIDFFGNFAENSRIGKLHL